MSKRDKEIKRLRREVEILRAQLKGKGASEGARATEGTEESVETVRAPSLQHPEPSLSYVRSDLRRSLAIASIITTLISALAFSQSHWPKVASFAAKVIPF